MNAKPTPAQIQAAQMVFIAESFYLMVKKEFDHWKKTILHEKPFYIAEEYYGEKYKNAKLDLPADRIARSPEHCPYIAGWSFTGTHKDSDAERFYTALRNVAIDEGFKQGEHAEQEAYDEWRSSQWAFIDATHAIHCMKKEDIGLDLKDDLLKILLGMLATEVQNNALTPLHTQYYNERMTEKEQKKVVFENNEASFTWFQALKKYIPVVDFLPTIIPNPDEEDKKSVEGIEYILHYMPGCYIYQMKPYGSWSFENFKTTSLQYAFINLHDELIESNDLQEVERALFQQFLQHLNV
jgi:hypothetical protein